MNEIAEHVSTLTAFAQDEKTLDARPRNPSGSTVPTGSTVMPKKTSAANSTISGATGSTGGYLAGSSKSGAGSVNIAPDASYVAAADETRNATAGSVTWSEYLANKTLSSAGTEEAEVSNTSSVAGSELPPDLTFYSPNCSRALASALASEAAHEAATYSSGSKRSAPSPYPASTADESGPSEPQKARLDSFSDWKIVVKKKDGTWGVPTSLGRNYGHFEIDQVDPSKLVIREFIKN